MKIIIDAMGGDKAPGEIVMGAIESAREFGVQILLVGRGDELLASMKERGIDTLPEGVEIAHADDVVDMHDDPADVVKNRKNSSMVLGLKMLADGQGDAFISAGSSGALLAAATLIVKRIHGIRRAAFGPVLPSKTGSFVLIDAGANNECTPEFLMQFGFVGSYFARKALQVERPRVGLLNNGTEDSKGMPLQREAYALLKKAGEEGKLNFIGNIEAREAILGAADVIVCDGFSGNIFLKTMEGTAMLMASYVKGMFMRNLLTKLGALFCRSGIREIKDRMDYRKIGGTILMGINKPVIKAHGASDAMAIRGAVCQAMEYVDYGFCEDIKAHISEMVLPKE